MIFVDVGSHVGQTIDEVRRYEYPFEVIHAIEPMPDQADFLRNRYRLDPHVVVHQFALSHTGGLTTMYGDNAHLEASLFPSKVDVDDTIRTSVRAVRASDFFDGLDGCIVNMNCEGGEVPILEDLLATGSIKRIAHLMVDFDARYVVGMEEAPRNIVKRLDASGIDYRGSFPDLPTHAEQIASWLESIL